MDVQRSNVVLSLNQYICIFITGRKKMHVVVIKICTECSMHWFFSWYLDFMLQTIYYIYYMHYFSCSSKSNINIYSNFLLFLYTLVAWEFVAICKLFLLDAGRRKARAVLERNPSPINVCNLQNPLNHTHWNESKQHHLLKAENLISVLDERHTLLVTVVSIAIMNFVA